MNRKVVFIISLFWIASCAANSPNDWIINAKESFFQSEYEKTIEIVDKALSSGLIFQTNESIMLIGLKAQSLSQLQRYDESIALSYELLKTSPRLSPVYYIIAYNCLKMKNYEESIRFYSQSIIFNTGWEQFSDVDLSKAYYFRGLCYLKLKDLKSAFRDFIKA